MPDIVHDLVIRAARERVFEAVSQPAGLDQWWTHRSSGQPAPGSEYELWFTPEYDWRAVVTRCEPATRFELRVTKADDDWRGTTVAFALDDGDGRTTLRFSHRGWPEPNDHYRVSCFCWAMYLRVLRRHLEHGERVPYDDRLDV